jgi:hypothetical protein
MRVSFQVSGAVNFVKCPLSRTPSPTSIAREISQMFHIQSGIEVGRKTQEIKCLDLRHRTEQAYEGSQSRPFNKRW